MRRAALVALLVVAGWMIATVPPAAAKPDGSEELLAAENAQVEAITHQDYDKLDKLLGDELSYCHASAHVDNKESFMKSLRDGEIKYLRVDSDDAKARVSGDIGIINGHFIVQTAGRDGKPRMPDHSWVTMIYAKRDGRWLLISYQATHPAAAPAITPVAR